jgi:hypothetical protein
MQRAHSLRLISLMLLVTTLASTSTQAGEADVGSLELRSRCVGAALIDLGGATVTNESRAIECSVSAPGKLAWSSWWKTSPSSKG